MAPENDAKIERNSDIWTAKEVAEYLKISKKTVYLMARTGDIPCTIIGNTIFRFSGKRSLL